MNFSGSFNVTSSGLSLVWRMCICAQSCLTLCHLVDCSLPGSSVYGISQARILGWVAISSFSGSSQPRDQTRVSCVSCIGRGILYHWTTWEARYEECYLLKELKDIVMCIPGSGTRILTQSCALVSWLSLPCLCISSLLRLAICPLEFREGHRDRKA